MVSRENYSSLFDSFGNGGPEAVSDDSLRSIAATASSKVSASEDLMTGCGQVVDELVWMVVYGHIELPYAAKFFDLLCIELRRLSFSSNLKISLDLVKELLVETLCLYKARLETQSDANDERLELLYKFMSDLVRRRSISAPLLCERVDMQLIGKLGLVSDYARLNQKTIRANTAKYYKQQKFNLLREEMEGYSKLVVELSMNQPDPPTSWETTEQRHVRVKMQAERVMTNVKLLIGYFELDPNRTLDLVLDVFTTQVVDQWRFFLDMLLLKNWSTGQARQNLVHLIGFKFSFYHPERYTQLYSLPSDSAAVPKTPLELALMTAILVKHGLVELSRVVPYLMPKDAAQCMKEEYAVYTHWFNLSIKRDDALNALQAAAPLTEETGQPKSSEAGQSAGDLKSVGLPTKEGLRAKLDQMQNRNQRALLLQALLLVGDLASFGRLFPTCDRALEMYDELPKLLCRCVEAMVDPLYDLLVHGRPTSEDRAQLSTGVRTVDYEMVYNHKKVKNSVSSPVFFYELWQDSLPRVGSWPEFVDTVLPMLRLLGPLLIRNPLLLGKLIKMVAVQKNLSKGQQDDQFDAVWKFLFVECFLTALSLQPVGAPYFCYALWSIIEKETYLDRFTLYSEYRSRSMKRHPGVKAVSEQARLQAGRFFKKLSNLTSRTMGRQLAKLCHANPFPCFASLLFNIQQNDKLIAPTVEACKYFTPLELDMLVYTIMSEMLTKCKGRWQEDGVHLTQWFSFTVEFLASICRKYVVDLSPILDYICLNLSDQCGDGSDLLLLKELIQKMSGIEVPSGGATTDAMIEGVSGLPTLRKLACFPQVGTQFKLSSQRLAVALLAKNEETPVFITLVEALGQLLHKEDQKTLDGEDEMPLKIVTDRLDFAYNVWAHLIEFAQLCELYRQLDVTSVASCSMCIPLEYVFKLFGPMVREPSVRELLFSRLGDASGLSLFYYDFWNWQLADLVCPEVRYEREISNCKRLYEKHVFDAKQKDAERAQELLGSLKRELLEQQAQIAASRAELGEQSVRYFSSSRADVVSYVLRDCLFPRFRMSVGDAIYCAKFVFALHNLNTPNFSTLHLFDRIFADTRTILMACTEREVRCFGRFVSELFAVLFTWKRSAELYRTEALGSETAPRCGFYQVWPSDGESPQQLQHADFCKLCLKWQKCLLRSSLQSTLSDEFVYLRNSVLFLTSLIDYFPTVDFMARRLLLAVSKRRKEESRQDLKLLLNGYASRLKVSIVSNARSEEEFIRPDANAKSAVAESVSDSADLPKMATLQSQIDETMDSSQDQAEEMGELTEHSNELSKV